jgi:hypothetical protein
MSKLIDKGTIDGISNLAIVITLTLFLMFSAGLAAMLGKDYGMRIAEQEAQVQIANVEQQAKVQIEALEYINADLSEQVEYYKQNCVVKNTKTIPFQPFHTK